MFLGQNERRGRDGAQSISGVSAEGYWMSRKLVSVIAPFCQMPSQITLQGIPTPPEANAEYSAVML
jgi:hypothetical protein